MTEKKPALTPTHIIRTGVGVLVGITVDGPVLNEVEAAEVLARVTAALAEEQRTADGPPCGKAPAVCATSLCPHCCQPIQGTK